MIDIYDSKKFKRLENGKFKMTSFYMRKKNIKLNNSCKEFRDFEQFETWYKNYKRRSNNYTKSVDKIVQEKKLVLEKYIFKSKSVMSKFKFQKHRKKFCTITIENEEDLANFFKGIIKNHKFDLEGDELVLNQDNICGHNFEMESQMEFSTISDIESKSFFETDTQTDESSSIGNLTSYSDPDSILRPFLRFETQDVGIQIEDNACISNTFPKTRDIGTQFTYGIDIKSEYDPFGSKREIKKLVNMIRDLGSWKIKVEKIL